MSGIRSRNTRPEITLRKALHSRGFRFRLHGRGLPGSPDLVFPKYRAVIFVHGCFWHRHPGCSFATTPSTRPAFWEEKFRQNIERDARTLDAIHREGWDALVIWECELKPQALDLALDDAERWLRARS